MDKDFVNPVYVENIQRKQKERAECYAKLMATHHIDETAQKVLNLRIQHLLEKLQTRELTAVQVLKAYTAKALEVTGKFNCCTEFIPQAEQWAKELDSIPKESIGPLHGLPVAIKDDHDVEGMDSTLGYAKHLYKPLSESAVMVKVLQKLGAVPFVKTNIPQSIMSGDSENPIFGTTTNCLNPKLSPGGSSSGSGCIVGAGGAPIATGSDLGGSLRNPAHFNGICTIRPTINRISGKGLLQCVPKMVAVSGVPGILAPDVNTLVTVWKAITANNIQNKFDPMVPPIPWNEALFSSQKKLTFSYFTSLSLFPAFADTQKTIVAAKEALIAAGHKVVPFEMPDVFKIVKTANDLYMADHGSGMLESFEGEVIAECMKNMVNMLRHPEQNVLPPEISERMKVMGGFGENIKTALDFWDVVAKRREYAEGILNQMKTLDVDLILSPVFPYPASKLGVNGMVSFVYTWIWNFMDFPAGVVRFGVETGSDIDTYDHEGDPVLLAVKNALPESIGMPIGVQIIGKPFKEEIVLRALAELEKLRP